MSELKNDLPTVQFRKAQRWTVVLATAALLLAAFAVIKKPAPIDGSAVAVHSQENALQRIQKTGIIRVGYGGFPPYTVLDLNNPDPNQRVKGFSIDLVEEIAKRSTPPLKVEWHKLNWETLKRDVDSGVFDFVADPVFQTIPRAADFELSEPYSYFGIAVAVVRKDDNRFRDFQDLDRPDITIALAAGWTSSEFAEKHLTKPKFERVSVEESAFTQLDYVTTGRADVALNDVPTVAQYVREHSDKVKALWLETPPSSVAGGFLTRKGETQLRDFLNASTRILQADGALLLLDKKWKTYGFFDAPARVPGAGLNQK